MEKLVLLSQAVCLSVIFYVIGYFLVAWQWPETLLSVVVCALVLYFLIEERDYAVDPIAAIAPDHT